jgi:hypothetical protein
LKISWPPGETSSPSFRLNATWEVPDAGDLDAQVQAERPRLDHENLNSG